VTLAERFDAFLIDLDGVVWRGDELIPGADEAVTRLRIEGKRVVFVTNNASRTPRDYAAKLMRMRIPTEPADVITSGHAVVDHLRSIGLVRGDRVHVCAARGLWEMVRGGGFEPTNDVDGVAAAVVAWNPDLVMDDIRRAADVARRGVPLIGANRDATYPVATGLLPGTGAILAAIEVASGRSATVVGKPEPLLVRLALERAGASAERSLFVGDRPDSDVAAARAAGMRVALVLTGVTTPDDVPSLVHSPDWVLADLAALFDDASPGPVVVVGEPMDGFVPPSPPEGDDQHESGDESADVREVGDAAALAGGASEAGRPAEQLQDEPQAE
jgi:4-nitrophenyl phosphatase